MKIEQIKEDAATKKLLYHGWLTALTPKQGAVLLAFVQDAYDKENGRSDHLDTKGNLVMTTALAALAVVAAMAEVLAKGLDGHRQALVAIALVVLVVVLIAAAILAMWANRVREAWAPPDPQVVMRSELPEVLAAGLEFVHRDLILHYIDNYIVLQHVSNDKADRLQRAQWCLFAAFVLATLIGLGRMFL